MVFYEGLLVALHLELLLLLILRLGTPLDPVSSVTLMPTLGAISVLWACSPIPVVTSPGGWKTS